MVFWKEWSFVILMTNKGATSIQTVFTLIIRKNFSAVFHLKTGVRELFVTLFNWSTEKSEVFSSLWLIRSATSIKTVFTVIIGKILSADFHSKTGRRELFVTFFYLVFWREWKFFILMTNKECYLYTNNFHTNPWKKFWCCFSLKNGSERTFSNTF